MRLVNRLESDATNRYAQPDPCLCYFHEKCIFVNLSNALFQNWHQVIFIFQIVSKNYLKNIIKVLNSLDPDQAWHFPGQIFV